MQITVKTADPAWRLAMSSRHSVLWLGPSWQKFVRQRTGGDTAETVRSLLARPWAAVFIDAESDPSEATFQGVREIGGLAVRLFPPDPPRPFTLENRRLPVYRLRGLEGRAAPWAASVDPRAYLQRLEMLRCVPPDTEVFAVGIEQQSDLDGLRESRAICRPGSGFSRVVVVSPVDLDFSGLTEIERLVHWTASYEQFLDLLPTAAETADDLGKSHVLMRTHRGNQSVNLAECVDASHPITERFEWISATEILREHPPVTPADIQRFLNHPAASWAPYARGLVFPRYRPYEEAVLLCLRAVVEDGPESTMTAWIPAHRGSGATTCLRQVCFHLAREGFPVLIAKPAVSRFEFRQLSAFLVAASARADRDGAAPGYAPWVLAFDAEHVLHHGEFIRGLANGLRQLMRPAIILAVRPDALAREEELFETGEQQRFRAQGINRELGAPLTSTVTAADARQLGDHFNAFLPPPMRRSGYEWNAFLSDTVRTGADGPQSLFWVALRFWLLRLPGSEQTFHQRILAQIQSCAGADSAATGALLEVAAMARHRLQVPLSLLDPLGLEKLLSYAEDSQNLLGLLRLPRHPVDSTTLAHPLIADEVLRVALQDSGALAAVGVESSLGFLDLELRLLGRLIRRPTAGNPENLPVIEELVTTSLRVDKESAPRNYLVRDRIVDLLEHAPDALFDQSQLFNHHLAKSRRHLAEDPPDPRWTEAARREQYELAMNHLNEAMNPASVAEEDRRESRLNLWVSTAVTLGSWARFERKMNREEVARSLERRADEAYQEAQRLDPDNSYVLENYARLKIMQARERPEDASRVRLLVDAISFLETERANDQDGIRDEPTLMGLAEAYNLLQAGRGEQLLRELAKTGAEAPLVALARLALRTPDGSEPDDAALGKAESFLARLKASEVTWRSTMMRYRILSRRQPRAFPRRLELLEQLDADREFTWPLQLRLEFGILSFQAGDVRGRKRGDDTFRGIRELLSVSSALLHVPPELRFLTDPANGFRERLKTFIRVTRTDRPGRSYYGIPGGWGNIDILFRPSLFGRESIRVGDELDCYILFTNYGPQAVPVTTE